MSNKIFNVYSGYYDLLYRDKNYLDEVAYLIDIFKRYQVTGNNLLEFGCGTGKHARILANKGYTVHGIELSADMLSRAEIVDGFTCAQGNITDISLGKRYDVVYSLFHVLSYQTANDQIHASFANAANHLHVGGLFIFDFWYTPAVYSQSPSVKVKRVADEKVEILRIAEPVARNNENRVDVHFTVFIKNLADESIQVVKENHPMRHFSLPEIDFLAEANGFVRVGAEEFNTGREPGDNTWGVCVILRRIK